MRTTLALVVDTFREALARKIFWGLFALSTLMIAFFLFLLKIDIVQGAVATISLLGQTSPKSFEVGKIVRQAQSGIATFLYTWGMFLAVFASSGLIPSVLEAGRIELLLSKPVRRTHIILGRYIGNVLVVGCNIAYLVIGVWMILGWKTGLWPKAFLLTIASTMFTFAVLLSIVILMGVLFESSALSTMVTVAVMLLSPILAQKTLMERLLSSEWSRDIWRGLYYALPKVYDIGRMTLDFVFDRTVESYAPLWSSAAFAVVVLSAGLIVFSKRDF
jgi:ABC-type transport system involved in multi-copper enzyme maturation permease subunit